MTMIVIIQLATAVACYAIGVFIGKQSMKKDEDAQIEHVGYDTEQMGREK